MGQVTSGGGSLGPFSQIFQQLHEMPVANADAKKGLASLEQLTQQVEDKGYVSQGDIQKLKNEASIIAPTLSAPQQELITQFMNEVNTQGGTGIPLQSGSGSGKNAFLNCSAVLMLFIMTSEIIGLESQIQLAENLYKAKLGLAILSTAESAYAATIAKGVIEAKQYKAQALKASIDASCALASIMTTVGLAITTKYMENVCEARYRQRLEDSGEGIPKDQPLSVTQKADVLREVEMEMQPLRGTTDGIIQMIKSTSEAAMDEKLAKLAIDSAQQQATADLLNKVADLLSQSASTLAKSADTDIAQAIQAQIELLATAIRTYGEIGSR